MCGLLKDGAFVEFLKKTVGVSYNMYVFHVKHVLKNEETLIKAWKPFEMRNVPRETMNSA